MDEALTACAQEADRLARHVPGTRSALTRDLARFNETVLHSQEFVVRSSQLWTAWKAPQGN